MIKVLIQAITPKVDFLEPEKWRRAVVNAGIDETASRSDIIIKKSSAFICW